MKWTCQYFCSSVDLQDCASLLAAIVTDPSHITYDEAEIMARADMVPCIGLGAVRRGIVRELDNGQRGPVRVEPLTGKLRHDSIERKIRQGMSIQIKQRHSNTDRRWRGESPR